jgi:diacylglycerol O-acyltransferase
MLASPETRSERYRLAREWGVAPEMNPLEALMWRSEADPRLRSTVAAVELLDAVPDWERLRAAHEWGSRMVHRFRQRVVEAPLGVGLPVWEDDPEFDLDRHLRRVRLEGGADARVLLDFAAEFASAPFDRGRPLWQAALVEGGSGAEAAYVLKLHHSMTDGLGNVQLLDMLHSDRREPTPDKPLPAVPQPRPLGTTELVRRQLERPAGRIPGAALRGGGWALRQLRGVAAEPARSLRDALGLAASLQRMGGPPPARPSPLLAPRSTKWHFEVLDVPLRELRAGAKAGGGSLNDGFLAAVLGGLRRYHEQFGISIAELPVAIPVSTRREHDSLGGNHFTGVRLAAPIGEPDPARRMQRVRELVARGRSEPALPVFSELAPLVGLLPAPAVAGLAGRLTQANDVQASNIPGLKREAYLAGARITHIYPFGPLPGCAAMISLVSHNDICCVGANLDPAAFTEPDLFKACLAEGFAEVLDLA